MVKNRIASIYETYVWLVMDENTMQNYFSSFTPSMWSTFVKTGVSSFSTDGRERKSVLSTYHTMGISNINKHHSSTLGQINSSIYKHTQKTSYFSFWRYNPASRIASFLKTTVFYHRECLMKKKNST